MKIKGWQRLKRLGRKISAQVTAHGLILIYHRVADLETDPQLLAVTPEHFQGQMSALKAWGTPISVSDMVRLARQRKLPRRAVAVTFDDGYADNLISAKPILERHGIPATCYVATARTGTRSEWFWDELESLLLRPGKLPEKYSIPVAAADYTGSLDDNGTITSDQLKVDRRWTVLEPAAEGSRQAMYRDLCGLIAPLPHEQRECAVAHVAAWSGHDRSGRDSHRMMNEQEIIELEAGGLIDVGGHTLTHPKLSASALNVQRVEIFKVKQTLENILGRPVTTFSYPFGGHEDYTPQTQQLVRDAGYQTACSNFPGPVLRSSDVYALPRVIIRDSNVNEFMAVVEGAFSA